MNWTLGLLVLAALGCSNDLDSLYAVPSRTADAGTPAAVVPKPLPPLPASPDDDHFDECARCAESTCSKPRANCLEDDDCIDELRCKGDCHDPACLQKCSAELSSLPRHGWSPWYADYANCVFGQCRSECNAGNNWQCQGNYDWPSAPTAMPFEVIFNFREPPTYFLGSQLGRSDGTGETVRACRDQSECTAGEIDRNEIGLDQTVALELVADAFQPQDFRGYLEIEGLGSRRYGPPLARSQEYFAGPGAVPPPTHDPARARVTAVVVDCLIAPAPGVRVTSPDIPEATALALNANSVSWVEAPTTSAAGIASLINLSDSAADNKLRVQVMRADAKAPISERAIWVRAGFNTEVVLTPAARSD